MGSATIPSEALEELHPAAKVATEENTAKYTASQAKLSASLAYDFTNIDAEDWNLIVEKVDSIEMQVKLKKDFVVTAVFDCDECDWQNTAHSLEEATVNQNSLTSKEASAVIFGDPQLQLLTDHWKLPSVTIIVVSNLPATTNTGNAFQRSYAYSSSKNSLCVRRERLADPGLLGMILLHGTAHIRVRDFNDDTNAEFLQSFYDGMQVLSEQLYRGNQ